MACKWILCVMFVIYFSIVSKSRPVDKRIYMVDGFKEEFKNCSLPKSSFANVSVNMTSLFNNTVTKFCSNVHTESAINETSFILCRQLLNTFASIFQCEAKEEGSKSDDETVMIPYPPNENFCSSVPRDEIAEKDKCFTALLNDCEKMCRGRDELCRLLLWGCQAKNLLHGNPKNRTFDIDSMSSEGSSLNSKIENMNVEITSNSSNLNHTVVAIDRTKLLSKSVSGSSSSLKSTVNTSTATKAMHVSPSTAVNVKMVSGNESMIQSGTTKKKSKESSSSITTTTTAVNQSPDIKDQSFQSAKVSLEVTQTSSTTLSTKEVHDSVKSSLLDKMETSVGSKDVDPSNDDDIQDYNDMTASNIATESRLYEKTKTVSSITASIKSDGKNSASYQPVHIISPVDSFDKEIAGDYMQSDDSHFFLFFICVVGLIIGCYVLFHNKQKIMALIIEGRHERRRRPNGASYKKLETKQ